MPPPRFAPSCRRVMAASHGRRPRLRRACRRSSSACAIEVFALAAPRARRRLVVRGAVFAERPGRSARSAASASTCRTGSRRSTTPAPSILIGTPDVRGRPAAAPARRAARRARPRRAARLDLLGRVRARRDRAARRPARRRRTGRYAAAARRALPGGRRRPARALRRRAATLLTSAGTAAGIDLCLHLVRRDHGARGRQPGRPADGRAAAPHRRPGAVRRRARRAAPAGRPGRPHVMQWALERLDERIGVPELAARRAPVDRGR